MSTYNFSVDAELLRELGERLVGRPHIALAELIKNSYDADATVVEIEFFVDRISVIDNGHGMSEQDFAERWMRIGTTRKRDLSLSPELGRTLTGSKGVGRLAAQLLARHLVLESVGRGPSGALEPGIRATVDWDHAVKAGELTSVKVPVAPLPADVLFAEKSPSGTRVILSTLTETWDEERFGALAQEVWALKPPFAVDDARKFDVVLKSDFPDIVHAFAVNMNAIFDIWNARITGRLVPLGEDPPTPAVSVLPPRLPNISEDDIGDAQPVEDPARYDSSGKQRFPDRYFAATIKIRDGSQRTVSWRVENCDIDEMEFEVRVFDLLRRQPKGIKVSEAREYLRRFGGVGVYDNGFRLPYYGAEQDWLKIERDHSARLTVSSLVPKELAVSKGLLDLPTNRRLFGWVAVSTNHEEQWRQSLGLRNAPGLSIQVTRDRLSDNEAYQQLQVMLRAAVDMYAMERARAKLAVARPVDAPLPLPPSTFMEQVVQTLSASKAHIPAPIYVELKSVVDAAVVRTKEAEQSSQAYSALLGALATAGMTSLAYEHEMSKQVGAIRTMSDQLERLLPDMTEDVRVRVSVTINTMRDWEKRVRAIRQVFAPLLKKETRESLERYRARDTVDTIVSQLRGLARGVAPDTSGIPAHLRLPRATYPAWSSIFQNVLINAYNALHDEPDPKLLIDGGGDDKAGWIRVSDNGVGVDLTTAAELWNPFERKLVLPPELEAAGLGGMGLGLTIVRMITDEVGVNAAFTNPPPGMNTSFKIQWKGKR
jgi:signal transduction histidine kinase